MSSLAKPTNPSSSSRFTNLTFLFVHLDFFVDAFNKRKKVGSIMGFSLVSGAGLNGNAPYQAQELQITTLANPRIQTNFLPSRLVLS